MKLIDLLVQELPKRGGWPEGAEYAWADDDEEIRFTKAHGDFYPPVAIDIDDLSPGIGMPRLRITREQYEAALAVTQQPVWDGEGLPPVGCECECKFNNQGDEYWKKVKILWTDESDVLCEHTGSHYPGTLRKFYQGALVHMTFRPITSERQETIHQIASLIGRGTFYEDASSIYDAIKSGDIKLSD